MNEYNHQDIEQKWQSEWEKAKAFEVQDHVEGRENYYLLVEYPYPSGNLHIGHWYAFAVPDILARAKRMQGRNVLFPMGFDSFGLPAENAAIKHGLDPRDWTYQNIDHMTAQLKSMGNSFDWSRKVVASDPEYYKWTQWLFLQLFEKGLVYRKKAEVNWCPKDNTVLANEQVVDSKCERCDTEVEKRALEQWFIRITEYAEKLLDGLNTMDWPQEIKDSQRNWIGKSEGAELQFAVKQTGITKAVLLHGKDGSPETNFFPWLKQSLEAQGVSVQVPALPNTSAPILEDQVAFVQENCDIDENTLVLGHSFGGLVAMQVLQGVAAKKLVLVATPSTDDFKDGKARPTVSAAIQAPIDFARVQAHVSSVEVLSDTHDEVVPASDADKWAVAFGVDVTALQAQETHFCADIEPAVLAASVPTITVFTTRPDTLFGATYMVIAPEHPLVSHITTAEQQAEVEAYVQAASKENEQDRTDATKEKTGVFTGAFAVNPATGHEIPVWIADYVLGSYGTGAIMAVPAHDERDHEFAKKFDIEITQVIATDQDIQAAAYTGAGALVNSGEFDGLTVEEAKKAITKKVGGKLTNNYKLRDWLISRQRYWGTPIPIVYDPEGVPHAIPKEHLPWTLPTDVDFTPKGEAPLATSKELLARTEKIFGKGWKPEVDTMDTFIDSSWYYLRYLDAQNTEEFASRQKIDQWMPVDRYSGGAEHTTMHLLYSRFFNLALYDLGLVPTPEPYTERMNRGLILGPDGAKMSKSRGNVIDPDENVVKFGSDAVKMYLAFIGPYNEPGTYPWDMGAISGVRRFLDRVWKLQTSVVSEAALEGEVLAVEKELYRTAQKVASDIEAMKFNTAISSLMILVNAMEKVANVTRAQYEMLLKILAPFAPHMTEELWHVVGNSTLIAQESWPQVNETYLAFDSVVMGVQVNGKMRGTIEIAPDADEATAVSAAQAVSAISKNLEGKTIVKTIFVPGKILNFIVK